MVVDLLGQVTKMSRSGSHLVGTMYLNLFIHCVVPFSISWIPGLYFIIQVISERVFFFSNGCS